MSDIKCERIAGEGEDALYNLFSDGKLVKAELTMDEVMIEINKGYEDEKEMIKDSGERREFETGAVRDIQEGKGRCDLLPLDVVEEMLGSGIFQCIADFQKTGNVNALYAALNRFSDMEYCLVGKSHTQRNADMILEVSKHFEEGAKKYGENNWQKGLPVNCYIDSAVRHYLKWLRGDADEPHDRAFVWNILCCIWTVKHVAKG